MRKTDGIAGREEGGKRNQRRLHLTSIRGAEVGPRASPPRALLLCVRVRVRVTLTHVSCPCMTLSVKFATQTVLRVLVLFLSKECLRILTMSSSEY